MERLVNVTWSQKILIMFFSMISGALEFYGIFGSYKRGLFSFLGFVSIMITLELWSRFEKKWNKD